MEYQYICGGCGRSFTSDTPERDHNGFLNDIFCPYCGDTEIYQDNAAGHAQSVRAQLEHEQKTEIE